MGLKFNEVSGTTFGSGWAGRRGTGGFHRPVTGWPCGIDL